MGKGRDRKKSVNKPKKMYNYICSESEKRKKKATIMFSNNKEQERLHLEILQENLPKEMEIFALSPQ